MPKAGLAGVAVEEALAVLVEDSRRPVRAVFSRRPVRAVIPGLFRLPLEPRR